MIDHKTWLSQIPADRRIALTEKANGPGLLRFAVQMGALGVFGALILWGGPMWWAFLLPYALILMCLFHMAHEATHGTLFRTRWLNKVAGHFAGFVMILPFHWFSAFHMAHHKWTNIHDKDPELERAEPQTALGWIWYLTGLPTWVSSVLVVLRLAIGREAPGFLGAAKRVRAEREARWMLAGYSALLCVMPFQPWIFWLWLAPLLIGQPFLRLYLLAEHGDLPKVANMFDNTRTTPSNRVLRWFTWNMPYHAEHHVWPSVPFHRLPEVHKEMRASLQHLEPSYRGFVQEFLSRRLRPRAQRVTQIRK